eukprot:tig00000981_g5869.t1
MAAAAAVAAARERSEGPESPCKAIVDEDPSLAPWLSKIEGRMLRYLQRMKQIEEYEGGLLRFAESWRRYGLHREGNGLFYREWAPGAKEMYLFGEFTGGDKRKYPCERNEFGTFTCFIPDPVPGRSAVPHGSIVKTLMVLWDGKPIERVPAWIRRAVQPPGRIAYEGVHWDPPERYAFRHERPPRPASLRIYECHPGMALEEPRVGTWREFADTVLPRVSRLGYNAIQLMAIQEHAYYASFGYHVTQFFAPSSRFGTPDDLRYLVDSAHARGILVLMDIVHAHASSNIEDGLSHFDGTDGHYFTPGPAGTHPDWKSRLFDYANWETQRFLLSNLRYYLEEFNLDGFRFDGVTSMLYKHHGCNFPGFSGNYAEYFGDWVDDAAVTYLTLANELVHALYPGAITVAEDVSGMPTLCRPVRCGGLGFDYRLGMGIPDKVFGLVKAVRDEHWDMGDLCGALGNRRRWEPTIAYLECHDQAMVGDVTLSWRLMGDQLHKSFTVGQEPPVGVERGMCLHKLCRLVCLALGGEAWLTFMGNEFGHPEWIDFPRAGNGDSFERARRRWSLARDPNLRYRFLEDFDVAMMRLEDEYRFMDAPKRVVLADNSDKVIVVAVNPPPEALQGWIVGRPPERAVEGGPDPPARLLLVFNFHPVRAHFDLRVGVPWAGRYRVVLDTDAPEFGTAQRRHVERHLDAVKAAARREQGGLPHCVKIDLQSRSAAVLRCEPEGPPPAAAHAAPRHRTRERDHRTPTSAERAARAAVAACASAAVEEASSLPEGALDLEHLERVEGAAQGELARARRRLASAEAEIALLRSELEARPGRPPGSGGLPAPLRLFRATRSSPPQGARSKAKASGDALQAALAGAEAARAEAAVASREARALRDALEDLQADRGSLAERNCALSLEMRRMQEELSARRSLPRPAPRSATGERGQQTSPPGAADGASQTDAEAPAAARAVRDSEAQTDGEASCGELEEGGGGRGGPGAARRELAAVKAALARLEAALQLDREEQATPPDPPRDPDPASSSAAKQGAPGVISKSKRRGRGPLGAPAGTAAAAGSGASSGDGAGSSGAASVLQGVASGLLQLVQRDAR